jgi:hypothetical protein
MKRRALALGTLLLSMLAILGQHSPHAGAAETYGEVGRFGARGTGPGQFELSRFTHAFGVDATENSVYVGDEPQPGSYRIQKLTSTGTFVAQTATITPPKADGIEGIAVEPTMQRIYVLALESRSTPEGSIAVAGTLYAFSTVPKGETLPPASGTKSGVLTTPAVFLAHAKEISQSLAEPHGIAVDPSTRDVIVMGEEETGEPESNPIVLQRVNSASGALEARYETTALDRETVSSPVVSPTGNVYVTQYDEVLQVPSDFASSQAPVRLGGVDEEPPLESEQALLMLPDPSASQGGGLSFAPVGPHGEPAGSLEAQAGILNDNSFYPGVVSFDAATGAETGWSGGATRKAGAACTIGFQGYTYPMVAAGAAGDVFVLDSQYAQVIEFGAGGEGCPTATDSPLKALLGGESLSGQIEAGTEVTLQSQLVQANAVSVEWSFDEGETKPLELDGNGLQRTEVTHTFQQPGEHVVTEVIHTDDLATPTIEEKVVVSVRSGRQPPTAVISGPIAVDVGQQASFDGSVSWDPNGHLGSTAIAHYEWSFGDGSSAVTETPEAQHSYAQTGLYTVSLTVEDAFGLKSEASSIPVRVQVAPPPAHEAPSAGSILTSGIGSGSATEASKTGASSGAGATAAPVARLASTSIAISRGGLANAVVSCLGTSGTCTGTLSLQTLRPVKAGRGARRKARALKLASAPFSITAGREQSVQLRLSGAARALLARGGTIGAWATIESRISTGVDHVARVVVKLRAPVKKLRSKGR